jgi:hypothetical protein
LATEEWNEASQLNAGRSLGAHESGRGPVDHVRPKKNQLPLSQPKGENLKEGGFDSDAPNASFSTDIGSKKDPGRVALNDIEASNTPYAGGTGPQQTKITNDGQFDSLGGDTSA